MFRSFAACVAVTALILTGSPAMAAVAGTVRGAEVVNVRRGPNPATPAFHSLGKGTSVAVEHVSGGWALVVLESGERGYVNATYLDLPPNVLVIPVEGGTPEATTGAAMVESPPPSAAVTASPIDEKLAQVLERVAALESALATPSAAPPVTHEAPPPPAAMPGGAEVPPPVDEGPSDLQGIGPALALAGVGFVVGLIIGTIYGQRQERNRRSRVRF